MLAVNNELIDPYWHLGRLILGRLILGRQVADGWGAKVVEQLSRTCGPSSLAWAACRRRTWATCAASPAAWPGVEVSPQVVGRLP